MFGSRVLLIQWLIVLPKNIRLVFTCTDKNLSWQVALVILVYFINILGYQACLLR